MLCISLCVIGLKNLKTAGAENLRLNNTSHLQSDSQMPYRNLFFFKDLNMKALLKKSKRQI